MSSNFKKKVYNQFPTIETEEIYQNGPIKGTVTYVSKGLGSAFGFLDSYLTGVSSKTEEKYVEQFNRLSTSEFASKHKAKWDYVK